MCPSGLWVRRKDVVKDQKELMHVRRSFARGAPRCAPGRCKLPGVCCSWHMPENDMTDDGKTRYFSKSCYFSRDDTAVQLFWNISTCGCEIEIEFGRSERRSRKICRGSPMNRKPRPMPTGRSAEKRNRAIASRSLWSHLGWNQPLSR